MQGAEHDTISSAVLQHVMFLMLKNYKRQTHTDRP